LEHYTLRWQRVAINWVKEDDAVIPQRKFEIPDRAYSIYLFPGGRWLLAATMDGSVQYFDLDTHAPRPAILIPPQLGPTYEVRPCMEVDIDAKATTLTFDLALVMAADTIHIRGRPGSSLRKIQIWKVSLDFDEQDRAVGFTSRCLCDFSEDRPGACYSVSLRDSRLAYCVDYNSPPRGGTYHCVTCRGRYPRYHKTDIQRKFPTCTF